MQSCSPAISRAKRGVGVRAPASPEWAPWEKCGEGHTLGEPETDQLIADGPSEGTGKGKCDREWAGLSHFGVTHLVQGWRMFSVSSCCLE